MVLSGLVAVAAIAVCVYCFCCAPEIGDVDEEQRRAGGVWCWCCTKSEGQGAKRQAPDVRASSIADV